MLALELNKDKVKPFMALLLREEMFDAFDARSVDITTTTRINIDGTADEGLPAWGSLRPLVYTIIKTCGKPRYVKIIFSYKAAQISEIHTNAAALFLNMIYENDGVTFTTATAQKEFVLDKSLDATWDEWVMGYFAKNELEVIRRE